MFPETVEPFLIRCSMWNSFWSLFQNARKTGTKEAWKLSGLIFEFLSCRDFYPIFGFTFFTDKKKKSFNRTVKNLLENSRHEIFWDFRLCHSSSLGLWSSFFDNFFLANNIEAQQEMWNSEGGGEQKGRGRDKPALGD